MFEVDHPATQAAKRRVVQDGAGEVARVRFVPVVFGTDDPAAKIANAGHQPPPAEGSPAEDAIVAMFARAWESAA